MLILKVLLARVLLTWRLGLQSQKEITLADRMRGWPIHIL